MVTSNPLDVEVIVNGSALGIDKVTGLKLEAQTEFELLIVPLVVGLVGALGIHFKFGSSSVTVSTVEPGPHSVVASIDSEIVYSEY